MVDGLSRGITIAVHRHVNGLRAGGLLTGARIGIAMAAALLVGSITGSARAEQPPDHFIIYPTKFRVCSSVSTNPGTPCATNAECPGGACASHTYTPFGPVQLTDTFATTDFKVTAAPALGLPADKNSEGIVDANTHLRQYIVKVFPHCIGGPHPGTACTRAADCGAGGRCSGNVPAQARRTVRITNQCSDALIEVTWPPTTLLLPAHKSLTDPVTAPNEAEHQVDHFLCYGVRLKQKLANGTVLPKFPHGMQAVVADQFYTRRYNLTKITRLCNPVAKQEDPLFPPVLFTGSSATTTPKPITPATIRNPNAHLVCYGATLATRTIAQNGCGAVNQLDHGTVLLQTRPTIVNGIFVNDQFGPARLSTTAQAGELCIPSTENICGNNAVELPEECDGTDNAACDGMACRADCTCTPPTCGNNIKETSQEACDGTDNAACAGLPCRPDCSCTPPSCGDNMKNQPVEVCDGTDDTNCPGQCNSHCLCPGPSCTQDPTRTLYAGAPGLGCFTFNGDQAACLSGYTTDDLPHLTQCQYSSLSGNCSSCDASSQLGSDGCTDTCNCGNGVLDTGEECDGAADTACPGTCQSDCRCPAPACTKAPGRTFAADGCASIADQSACDNAFYSAIADFNQSRSCYFVSGACAGCDFGAQDSGNCINVCACGNNVTESGEQCDGTDNNRCEGRACGADCQCAPEVCGDNIVNLSEQCDGTDDYACPGQCLITCQCP